MQASKAGSAKLGITVGNCSASSSKLENQIWPCNLDSQLQQHQDGACSYLQKFVTGLV